MENKSMYDELDNFVKRLHNREIIIDSEAKTIWLTKKDDIRQTSLAMALGQSVFSYQTSKDELRALSVVKDPLLRKGIQSRFLEARTRLSECMELAYTYNVVKDQTLLKDVEKAREQLTQLKEENDKLKKENLRLTQLNEELHRTIDKLGAKRIQ